MKPAYTSLTAGIALLLLLSVTACKPDLVTVPELPFPATSAWLAERQATISFGLPNQSPALDQAFKQGYLLIYGEGTAKQNSEHAGQRRLTAIRAAEVVAQRNLATLLSDNGRQQTVRFDTFTYTITTPLRGFEVVNREYNESLNKAAVLIKFDLKGAKKLDR